MITRFDERIKLNMKRLLSTDDTYNDLYEKDASMSWPGDFVGRYFLALASLYVGLDDEKDKKEVFETLTKLISKRNEFTNSHHFFGKEFNDEVINEQQMSGNSWYIRSLVAYYRITKDEEILKEIIDIKDNFLLKVAPHYNHYPLVKERNNTEVSGKLEETVINGFLLSSDIGCAFILLDGFVDVYSVTKDEKLKESIENIISIFEGIDYLSLKCQTHATLTCSRAILRFYQFTNNKHYLDFVIKTFDNYQKYGMTIDYQNINWFGRIDSWTEPCCVVDSFILAHDLYLITNENHYLKLFNKITTTSLRSAQRNNGGAGCTAILVSKDEPLKCFMYEAWFCCSMRLAEGLKYLSESRLIETKDNTILVMLPDKVNKKGISIDIDYYFKKEIKVSSESETNLLVYIPSGTKIVSANVSYQLEENLIKFTALKGTPVIIKCEHSTSRINDAFFLGDMLLTQKENHLGEVIEINGKKYSYVLSSSEISKEELESTLQYL